MKQPKICDQCHAPITVSIMSKLNTDILCMDCKDDEKALPSYQAGATAESDAVCRGHYNFPGVGLTQDDRKFLIERCTVRRSRHT